MQRREFLTAIVCSVRRPAFQPAQSAKKGAETLK